MRCSCFSFLKRRRRSRAMEGSVSKKSTVETRQAASLPSICLPNPAGVVAHHGLSDFASPCLLELRHILHHAVHPIPARRVRVGVNQGPLQFRSALFAPHSAEAEEEALFWSVAVDLFGRFSGRVGGDHFPHSP